MIDEFLAYSRKLGEGDFIDASLLSQEGDRITLTLPNAGEYTITLSDQRVSLSKDDEPIGEAQISDLETYRFDKSPIDSVDRWLNKTIGDNLGARYTQELREQFNWEAIVKTAKSSEPQGGEGEEYGIDFLGTVFALTPSGKFYTPWASGNITPVEANVDACWNAALEKVAEEHGGWVGSGEGDPCDIMFGIGLGGDKEDAE